MALQEFRLTLRPMTPDDAALYHRWRNDAEVMALTSPSLVSCTLAETIVFVKEAILGNPAAKPYMVIDKASGTVIGLTSLVKLDALHRNAECMLEIGNKAYWGQGYGQEALRLLLDHAFYELKLHRLSLRVFSFNQRALALYEKVGFRLEGRARQSLLRNGVWHDILYMGLLRDEYRAAGKPIDSAGAAR